MKSGMRVLPAASRTSARSGLLGGLGEGRPGHFAPLGRCGQFQDGGQFVGRVGAAPAQFNHGERP
jgi:hypothetical protein